MGGPEVGVEAEVIGTDVGGEDQEVVVAAAFGFFGGGATEAKRAWGVG
jgi:hypothetical protein